MEQVESRMNETSQAQFEREFGVTASTLQVEGVLSRMRRAASELEAKGLDPEDLFMNDRFMNALFHDFPVDDDEMMDAQMEAAEELGYDV